jgi:hypothetical protein
MKPRQAAALAMVESSGRNTISKTGIAILFIIVISALCVAVYEAWLNTFQAERADNFRLIPANGAVRDVLWVHA